MPGIESEQRVNSLCKQIVSSIHRVQYVQKIRERNISALRIDPTSNYFDPLKASIFYYDNGDIDEAFWLIFLSVHFGKHGKDGWRLLRDIYSQLGKKNHWNWKNTSSNPYKFREWLDINQSVLKDTETPRRFGNHRKYESLDAWSNSGTGLVVESYVDWVKSIGNHQNLIIAAENIVGKNPGKVFDYLYNSMATVQRFGRTARFDFLTMIGKLNFAKIEPRSPYLQGATGPLRGAKLLFGNNNPIDVSTKELDKRLVELGDHLNVGMQVIEDSLCNWQKRPDDFVKFRG